MRALKSYQYQEEGDREKERCMKVQHTVRPKSPWEGRNSEPVSMQGNYFI